jgi:hypothetical protein
VRDIREQLNRDLADTDWQDLLPHAKRDAIIVIETELNLLDAATAIATDDKTLVQTWIDRQLIAKPSASQLARWNEHPQTHFTVAIVQPFVLIQEIG